MKLNLNREWFEAHANCEDDLDIGAGTPHLFLAVPQNSQVLEVDTAHDLPFGRLVLLLRTNASLTLAELANALNVAMVDLQAIEDNPEKLPKARHVYEIADYFQLPRKPLMAKAGLIEKRMAPLTDEHYLFAASSKSLSALTADERLALEHYVAALRSQQD